MSAWKQYSWSLVVCYVIAACLLAETVGWVAAVVALAAAGAITYTILLDRNLDL